MLRIGGIVSAIVAYFAWLIVPPLETIQYKKYDVQSKQQLTMPMMSLADVGSRPIVSFSAQGDRAAFLSAIPQSDDEDAALSISVIDTKTAKPIGQTLSVSQSRTPPEIVFSRDGNFLAAAVATEVRLWDLRDQGLVSTITVPDVRLQSRRHVAISNDGTLVATSVQEPDQDPALWVFESATGNALQKMQRTAGTANHERFVFHPRKNQLIGTCDTESGTTSLCVWDIETGKVDQELLPNDDSQTLAFALNQEHNRLAVAMFHGARQYDPFSTMIFDLNSWESQIDISNDDYVFWLAFSPDGKHLSLVDGTGMASIWSTESGLRLQNIKHGPPSATAFSQVDGALHLIVNEEDQANSVSLVTLRPGE